MILNGPLGLFSLAFLGSIVALAGGLFFLYNRRWSALLEAGAAAFAAGVLLTVTFLGLIPEALEHAGEITFMIVLLSFFGSYLFEYLMFGIHHHGEHSHDHHHQEGTVALVIVGDTIHNFIDGVAIGVSFLVAPSLGLVTAISSFLHEVPHEIGDFGILLRAGWRKGRIILVNVVSAFATIFGAFLIYFFPVGDSAKGILLGISAGIFLYLGASDFLPQIEHLKGSKLKSVLPLIIGAVLMMLVINLVPHTE